MKRVSPGAARRYARALLDVALEQADATALRQELSEAAVALSTHPELAALLSHPALSVDKKKSLVAAVFAPERASELLRRLLGLLVEANRTELLPAIASSYAALLNAHHNVAAADVVSATPIEKDQLDAIAGALKRATGMGIELKTSLEPALLAGVVVKIGGRHFDGSVRGRLQALRARLTGAQGS